MNKEIITEKLQAAGLLAEEIEWKTDNYFRYGYWKRLPANVFNTIKEFVEEDLYEDDDGDGPGGRPIIIKRYSYFIKK